MLQIISLKNTKCDYCEYSLRLQMRFSYIDKISHIGTYSSQLYVLGDAVLPGEAEDMWQIEGEVDDAAAGGRHVGLVEEHTHQETLHDGGNGESQEEEEDEDGVAVIQHLSTLKERKVKDRRAISLRRPSLKQRNTRN